MSPPSTVADQPSASPRRAPLVPVRWLRIVALAETVTYLCLLASVVNRRVLDGPDLSSVIGPVHGLVFLAYMGLILVVRQSRGWSWWFTFGALLAAVIPLGAFVLVERRLAD